MTRKDYVTTATILRDYGPAATNVIDSHTFANLVDQFAAMFTDDNPRFDATKFYEACGLDAE